MSVEQQERPLPAAPEAEAALLGGFLLETPGIEDAFALDTEDFYDPRNRVIFATLRDLRRHNRPTNNLVTLVETLRESGQLEAVGVEYCSALDIGVPRIQPVETHIAALRRTRLLRRVIRLGDRAWQPHGERAFPELLRLAEMIAASSSDGLASEPAGWRDVYHSYAEFESAQPLTFAIQGFLQNNGATMIGGLSGHSKTFINLSITKALLAGKGARLWDLFDVLENAVRVVYLIPECAIEPFKHRLRLFGLYKYLAPEDGRLLVRTLSKGPAPDLSDPRILFSVKGAHVILDTAARFSEGDENSASDNQRGLATDVFALLASGARSVIAAHHSPKPFAKENVMKLETVLRGSGDVGAMLTTAWGVKQLDPTANIVHIENIKPRDFQPCGAFQLIGRPFIDEIGDFRLHKRPGECGALQDEQEPERDKGGAPVQAREARSANVALVRTWLADDPGLTSEQLVMQFSNAGIKVSASTVRKYKMELGI